MWFPPVMSLYLTWVQEVPVLYATAYTSMIACTSTYMPVLQGDCTYACAFTSMHACTSMYTPGLQGYCTDACSFLVVNACCTFMHVLYFYVHALTPLRSQETSKLLGGSAALWITNEFQHSGLRDQPAVFEQLLKMSKGEVVIPS